MPISEQRYQVWCGQMAAKAAFEKSGHIPPTLESSPEHSNPKDGDRSNAQSFQSAPALPQSRFISSGDTVNDSPSHNSCPATLSHPARSTVPLPSLSTTQRRSSHLSITARRRSDLHSFYRESCELFASLDEEATDSGYASLHRQESSQTTSTASLQQQPTLTVSRNGSGHLPPATSIRESQSPSLNVISWKSEETRRIEYEKIDRAHRGLRGFCGKILPRFCQSKKRWRNFFDGKCDGDSVRRMRMPFSDDAPA